MKKVFLFVFVMAVLLVFTAKAGAAVIVGFSGPYEDAAAVNSAYGLDIGDVTFDRIMVCNHWVLTEKGYNISSYVDYAGAWLFQAGEDLPDFEIYATYPLEASSPTPYDCAVQVTPSFLHFVGTSGPGGILEGQYFDIHVDSLGDASASGITIHPTTIPGAVWLLASGLIGLLGVRRRLGGAVG